ncbi:MAG: cytochrome-c peroxidase [Planctomycetaceae bacterium]
MKITSVAIASFAIIASFVAAPFSPSRKPAPHEGKVVPDRAVILGSDELTSGIPGEGNLKLNEIERWLDEPKNHQPLKLQLPVGLDLLPNRLDKLPTPLTRAKIELGRQLFFDTRLSLDHTTSCATCHDPDHGYTIPKRFGVGVGGQKGTRNPPTLINRLMFAGIGEEEFWDGHAASLEDAVLISLTDPAGMASSLDRVIKTLRTNRGYDLQFTRIYQGVTVASIGDAMAAFIRVIVSGASPYDYQRAFEAFEDTDPTDLNEDAELLGKYRSLKAARDANPMSNDALAGMKLFFGMDKAWCIGCHASPALTDNMCHNIGVGMEDASPDLGRFLTTRNTKDRGAFKTPTLRNVIQTAPYMHDGRFKTLEDVLRYYGSEKFKNPHLDARFEKLRLTPAEQAELVAFIKACAGPLPRVERGRLPAGP